jgi:hypothetical protein
MSGRSRTSPTPAGASTSRSTKNRVNKYPVNQTKNYGINLGWLDLAPSAPKSFSVAMSAQPIVQAWVPYLGSFGQHTQSNLLTVQNASENATLMFVEPGKSTNRCSRLCTVRRRRVSRSTFSPA